MPPAADRVGSDIRVPALTVGLGAWVVPKFQKARGYLLAQLLSLAGGAGGGVSLGIGVSMTGLDGWGTARKSAR